MVEHDEEDHAFGPTYKSLFLGACIIIGSAFGWWFSNFIATQDSIHAAYDRRLTQLETGAITGAIKQDRLEHDVEEHTRVLRELEREAVRRRP